MATNATADRMDFDPDDIPAIQLDAANVLTDEETEALAGERLNADHYDTLIEGDEPKRVYKPNGDLLAVYLPNVIARDTALAAYTALRPVALKAGKQKGNRFQAAGGARRNRLLEDGSMSKTQDVPREVNPNTGVAGNFDRYPRIPYCRSTAFNTNQPEKFAEAVPLFQRCDELFQRHVPDRYANQYEKANETVDDWLIPETAFTTVTVNVNWQTACHTDSGDLPEGFGVMPVIKIGDYEGAYFIEPKFRIAYDGTMGDLLLNDVHEWHGNGPFHEAGAYYERMSVVLYYREKMTECGTPEEETQRAKALVDERDFEDFDGPGYGQEGDHGGHRTFETPAEDE